jgi:hypothetical protein
MDLHRPVDTCAWTCGNTLLVPLLYLVFVYGPHSFKRVKHSILYIAVNSSDKKMINKIILPIVYCFRALLNTRKL